MHPLRPSRSAVLCTLKGIQSGAQHREQRFSVVLLQKRAEPDRVTPPRLATNHSRFDQPLAAGTGLFPQTFQQGCQQRGALPTRPVWMQTPRFGVQPSGPPNTATGLLPRHKASAVSPPRDLCENYSRFLLSLPKSPRAMSTYPPRMT